MVYDITIITIGLMIVLIPMGVFIGDIKPLISKVIGKSLISRVVTIIIKLLYIHIPIPLVVYYRNRFGIPKIYTLIFVAFGFIALLFGKYLRKRYEER
ncbi:MAG: hypothetical protein CSA15_03255 [Candidatus Delongbacteria bacterium]|nr:MAG: hypothetical protein CSA15_03255 [Candidatus Delongbacteria bacterium]